MTRFLQGGVGQTDFRRLLVHHVIEPNQKKSKPALGQHNTNQQKPGPARAGFDDDDDEDDNKDGAELHKREIAPHPWTPSEEHLTKIYLVVSE